ncbi:MAG TPA: large conductance mechanosensitive channel protein MscL [Chthoniobacteraceae bacterium]|jgi:large conductance mechanosensitive channel|nr:large conductance mechanosensitive channel protein MscL [Chthoniobacteraceae bacterium]
MSVLSEFKAFVLKGNVVDLAVGVVIGASFKSVVDSVVADLITPLIGAIGGNPDFSSFVVGPLSIGKFLNAIIAFVILAAVVFFLVVKPMNHLMERMKKKAETQPEAAPLPEDVKLLMEIRDLLKAGQSPAPPAVL